MLPLPSVTGDPLKGLLLHGDLYLPASGHSPELYEAAPSMAAKAGGAQRTNHPPCRCIASISHLVMVISSIARHQGSKGVPE